VYAVSNTTYGTTTPPSSRLICDGVARKLREKYPEITMNAGMCTA
jgi:hypothetical protein